MIVDSDGCFLFYGIIAKRDPGDVTPEDVAIKLGWVKSDRWGCPVDPAFNHWEAAEKHFGRDGLEMGTHSCDGYPLTFIFAKRTWLESDDEYPLAFKRLPTYTEIQHVSLRALAQELDMKLPRWHLGSKPVE